MAICRLDSNEPPEALARLYLWLRDLLDAHPDDAMVLAAVTALRMLGTGSADWKCTARMAIRKIRENYPDDLPPDDPDVILGEES